MKSLNKSSNNLVFFLEHLRVIVNQKWLIFAIAAIVSCVFGFYNTPHTLVNIPPQTGHVLSCTTDFNTNQDVFTVYVTDVSIAKMALPRLCDNSVIKKQYGQVSVIVGQNDYDTFRYINHGIIDLALVKNIVVEAFGAEQIYGLTMIAKHPNYSAYFIALREKPKLTKEYLLGKRIGLLDYPSSRSGYIVPKTIIQKLGLNEQNITIKYYNSHNELRRGLLAGEIDIISSYWGDKDNNTFSKNYATPLIDSVSGMRWYIKMQTQNTDLMCAVQAVIKEIASQHPSQYYNKVILTEGCAPNV